MAIPRASSGLLRSQIPRRPAAVTTPLGSITPTAAATQIRLKSDDLGGPGGQKPPPKNPGGPEALSRNWPAIGGAALLVVGAYAYLTGGGPKKGQGQEAVEAAKQRAEELKKKGQEQAEQLKSKGQEQADQLKAKGQEGIRQLEKFDGKDAGVNQLSGRKQDKMGGFRGE